MGPVRHPNSAGPPAEWCTIIPHTGILLFDYLSYARAPPSTTPVTDEQLRDTLLSCGIKFIADTPQTTSGMNASLS